MLELVKPGAEVPGPKVVCPRCGGAVEPIVWAVADGAGIRVLPPQVDGDDDEDSEDSASFGCLQCGWHGLPAATTIGTLLILSGHEDVAGLAVQIGIWAEHDAEIAVDGKVLGAGDTEWAGDSFVVLFDDGSTIALPFPVTVSQLWDAVITYAEECDAGEWDELVDADSGSEIGESWAELEDDSLLNSAHEFASDVIPDEIRIPSASGAAIILTPVSWVSNDNGVASLVRLWDVTLVEPTRSVCYRRRQFTDADFVALLGVLKQAMIDDFPHAPTEPEFSATMAGMQLSVPSSTSQDVDLQIDMVIFLDEPIADYDQMRFTTARAALWEPVQALRALTGRDVDDSTPFDLGR